MREIYVVGVRVVLVLSAAGLVLTQALILPLLGSEAVDEEPTASTARWVVLVLAVAALGTVELAMVCVWRLLALAQRRTLFVAVGVHRTVDALVWCGVACGSLGVAILGVLAVTGLTQFSAVLGVLAVVLVGYGEALLVLVLRALLVEATSMRTELDEVI